MNRPYREREGDVIDVEPVLSETRQPDPRGERQRNYMYAVYGLYAASIFTVGLAAVAGAVVAALKQDEMAGTFYESHLRYLIRTFWGALIGFAVGGVLSVILIGIPIVWLTGVWYVFRVAYGIVRLLDGRPVTPTGWLM
ncbi:Predicted membrane protein [Kingella potus]|uniref:Predicted membrane protein n=1 Tax=Kingella potus TaxID=265175 RepID=A0A377R2K7_9NEIS|nr:hypothetical protein [Kingella potus]UOP00206.1 hypothetical protein LVJ84_09745 [Kingella potus]STR02731.1 Predicted membrane protein [Kingella potus]